MAELRVLHCIPGIWPGSGGPSRAIIEMVNAIGVAAPDIRVDIATTDYGLTPQDESEVSRRLPAGSVLRVFPQSRWLDAGFSLAMARWLEASVRDYDVVHVHSLFNVMSSTCLWISRRHEVPYVVRPLGTLSPYTFSHRRGLLKRVYHALLDRPLLSRASAIHFTTAREAEKASRLELSPPAVVIPIPVAMESSAAPTRSEQTDQHRILFLSRLHPVKGLDRLLPAFALLQKQLPAAKLVIAGSGPAKYTEELRQRAASLGVLDAIEWQGFVVGAAKESLFRDASIFVLPSYQENFGVAVVEALAAGVPVVITNEVDLSPDVAQYGSGILTGGSPAAIAAAMQALLTDPDRAGFGVRARRQVQELYAPLAVGGQLVRLYQKARAAHASHSVLPEPTWSTL